MITLRCIDPESTWPLDLHGGDGAVGIRLHVRHLNVRDYLHFREMRLAAIDAKDDPEQVDGMAACLRFAVRRIEQAGQTITIDELLERVTIDVLAELVKAVHGGQRLSGADLGKSGSARPSAAAPSAPDAGVESA